MTKFDPRAAALADRHYTRQTVGSPQFMPSGRTIVLLTPEGDAVWGTHWAVGGGILWSTHDWPYAWNCLIFRNESVHLSSELVVEAVAATRALWGSRPSRDSSPSSIKTRCAGSAIRAAATSAPASATSGITRSGKVALQLAPEDFPQPELPIGGAAMLFAREDEEFTPKRAVFGGALRRIS